MPALNQDIVIALDELTDELFDIVEEEVIKLHNGLIDAGQAVWLTGNFKNSFSPVTKHSPTHWSIDNDAEYSDILANGRVFANGRWYGSIKWEHGIDPMIAKMIHNIEVKQERITK